MKSIETNRLKCRRIKRYNSMSKKRLISALNESESVKS